MRYGASAQECGGPTIQTQHAQLGDQTIEAFDLVRLAARIHPFSEASKFIHDGVLIFIRHIEAGLHQVDPFESELNGSWQPLRLEDVLRRHWHQPLLGVLAVSNH